MQDDSVKIPHEELIDDDLVSFFDLLAQYDLEDKRTEESKKQS